MPEPGEENTVTIIRRQPLDAKGLCSKCSSNGDHEAMQCFGCSEYYHVINCPPGNKKGQVTHTFYDGWDNMLRNYGNIQYICDACLHDKKLKCDIIVSNRMCVMEEEMKEMKGSMDRGFNELREIVQKLVKNKEEMPAAAVQPVPTYAETTKSSSSVIVIKKKRNGPPADIEKIHQAAVNSNASVSNTYRNNSGDTVVVLENQASKDAILPVIEEEIDKEQFTVVTPKQRQPTITIINIEREYSKEELLKRVKEQNTWRFGSLEVNETNFKVIYMKKQFKNPALFKAVVRVSNEVRQSIDNSGDHLNIGVTSCSVFDDFFVKRCNRCQRLNHWKDDCSHDLPVVCGRCGEQHETRTCQSHQVKCCNCVQAGYTDTAHETSSLRCQAYMDAQKKVQSTINYYKDKPKNIKRPNW